MSAQQRGPQGRPPSKNPGSESVTNFPGHTCLWGSVCVLGTGFWKLGPVSPGPHPLPHWTFSHCWFCFAASRCDGLEPRGPMCPVLRVLLLEPGVANPGLFLVTTSPFHCAVIPVGQLSTDSHALLACLVCSAGWPPSCRTCFRLVCSLHTTPCSKSVSGERVADVRENQQTALPGGGLGVDSSGDRSQAGLGVATPPGALHCPQGGVGAHWGPGGPRMGLSASRPEGAASAGVLCSSHCEWGGPRWGSEGQKACPSRGPLGLHSDRAPPAH